MSRGSIRPSLLGLIAAVIAAAVVAFMLLRSPPLGPVDGEDLPPTDLERVAVGDRAPDFSLLAYSGDVISLSDYRGEKNVVLVFYRGHW